jgi:hypothetical protein
LDFDSESQFNSAISRRKMSIFNKHNHIQVPTFFPFKTPGDKIEGVIVNIFDIPERVEGKQTFAAQLGFTLEVLGEDNEAVMRNVGIKRTSVNVEITKNFKPGDVVGFDFTHTIPNKTPNPTKNIEIYHQAATAPHGESLHSNKPRPA